MVQLVYGNRIGAQAPLMVVTAAAVLDPSGQKVLLTRRSDNGRWCLPGGRLEPGESAAEGCAREALEETGLTVRITRLVGVYSSPDMLVAYPDGNRYQVVALTFEADVAGGEPAVSDETTAWGWFSPAEFEQLDIMQHHRERLADVFARRPEAFYR
jgi:ADP-ribose pyrophosphatase YjhB (NUDIX family)